MQAHFDVQRWADGRTSHGDARRTPRQAHAHFQQRLLRGELRARRSQHAPRHALEVRCVSETGRLTLQGAMSASNVQPVVPGDDDLGDALVVQVRAQRPEVENFVVDGFQQRQPVDAGQADGLDVEHVVHHIADHLAAGRFVGQRRRR